MLENSDFINKIIKTHKYSYRLQFFHHDFQSIFFQPNDVICETTNKIDVTIFVCHFRRVTSKFWLTIPCKLRFNNNQYRKQQEHTHTYVNWTAILSIPLQKPSLIIEKTNHIDL